MKNILEAIVAAKKKDKDREAVAANMLAQILRGGTKMKCSVRPVRMLESAATPATAGSSGLGGPKFKVVIIDEGLGNSADNHFYSRECVESSPTVFEGQSCFLNHPGSFEERDRPERDVRDKCGAFKNCHVEYLDGKAALVAELHTDLSEAGREAASKMLSALRYRENFPGRNQEYIGISINANGVWEKRTLAIEGKKRDVKYVTKLTAANSADVVTDPGRGGRVLALVESAAGANRKREATMLKEKLTKLFEAVRNSLKAALTESDPAKVKEKLTEADASIESLVQEAARCSEDDAEEAKKKLEAEESAKKKKEADDAAAKAKKDKEDEETMEANRLAIQGLLKEAGLPDGEITAHVTKLPLQEAKAEIERLKKFKESIARSVVKTMGIPAAQFSKLSESERKEAGGANNSKFAGCKR